MLVTYGDVPLLDADTLAALLAEHTAAGAAVTLLTTELADPTGYGRVLREADGTVTGIVEQADATPEQRAIREVNSGVYAFDAAFLDRGPGGRSRRRQRAGRAVPDRPRRDRRTTTAPVRSVGCPDQWQVRGRQRPGPARRSCAPS